MASSPSRITSAEKRGLIALLILLLLLSLYLCRDHIFTPSASVSDPPAAATPASVTDSVLERVPVPGSMPRAKRSTRKRRPASAPAQGKYREPPLPRSPRDEPVN